MKIALAQIAPVFLDRAATIAKIGDWVASAADAGCSLVCFGEALAPGYPFWLSRLHGASFNNPQLKRWHAAYVQAAVCIEEGHLQPVCAAAKRRNIAVVVGIIERPHDRGGHSLFCSRVFIGTDGQVLSVHRKLMPTYEERLAWGAGDGAGLCVHRVGPFTVGALNCWENWMPLARAALYAQGEDLHVMIWPGSVNLTRDLTRFVALESRSFVASVGAILRESDLPAHLPDRDALCHKGELIYNGGSCIAGPDGSWIVEPQAGGEHLLTATLDIHRVLEERQNFDAAGHYSRPDVLRLGVDRRRHRAADLND